MKYLSVCSGIEIGQRFGRLIVTEIYFLKRKDQCRIKLLCDCGNEVDTNGGRLRSGSKKSCGCLRRDRAGERYRKHGKSKTLEYTMFYDARKRAIAANIPFTITPDDIVIPKVCPVLGITLVADRHRDNKPSLDKIIQEKGYTPENIKVISFRANRLKSDATVEEIRAIISYIEGWLR
jgi:hypothetical protein